MQKRIIVTGDNSKTIYLPELDETYHSRHGAMQESSHVFIDSGLDCLKDLKSVTIFEMGFGTGLNCFLAYLWGIENNIAIHYNTIEKFPLENSFIEELHELKENKPYLEILEAEWGIKTSITSTFTLKKMKQDIFDLSIKQTDAHIVFYDAFGPKTQPLLWEIDPLKKMYSMLKPEGIFITYCAQGQFKRNLKEIGFAVENLPGPPGKREITKAIKI